jgi:hypothetical protein
MAFSTKAVIKAIGDRRLRLVDGGGYWYFIFDDIEKHKVYETYSIAVMRLSDMPLDHWIEEGNGFLAKMKQRIEKQKLKGLT